MIKSFKDALTEAVSQGENPGGKFPANLLKIARRKLAMVNAAAALNDLKAPPGNKLHELKNDRAGQHAIWINDQYRVCFTWTRHGPENVEITDYHD